ncbi:1-phosphatidylinositol 4,5-bisphosphate phosphodiesterase gamma-1-like [Myiozetetes cayanensis]|uniref:1-phosphatidylinositol 4,5-bisphosphate phosphodiesterase gamma-1-like n=1 Tax=Myiozetetes cayanensis TaxID=478635 RepID=UPI00215F0E48|nr:1-phosphatidylinositol 4,5-bisphosphate phosphodiesterase gamma-1-like [Myiozetetes cayanensis]
MSEMSEMSMARLGGVNGFLQDARMEAGDMGRVLRCLEMGTVLTLFYQKKSQRPERRTFQVKLETRQIVWSRTPEKVEGDSEYRDSGVGGRCGAWGCPGMVE